MVATPQYFTAMFSNGGPPEYIDGYISDVADAYVRWDGGQGAGAASPTEYKMPRTQALVSMNISGDPVDTTKVMVFRNGKYTNNILRYLHFQHDTVSKPSLLIWFNQGDTLQLVQKAN